MDKGVARVWRCVNKAEAAYHSQYFPEALQDVVRGNTSTGTKHRNVSRVPVAADGIESYRARVTDFVVRVPQAHFEYRNIEIEVDGTAEIF